MERLDTFYYRGEHRPVRYVETDEAKPGVVCDIYQFIGENAFDLAIVTVAPNCSTPLQRVAERFSTTIEGVYEGSGIFFLESEDKTLHEAGVPKTTTVYANDLMQWTAGEDGLTFFEICHPPYEEGGFVNLTD
jgi:hypothetical protein